MSEQPATGSFGYQQLWHWYPLNILLLCNCCTGTRPAALLSPRWLLLSVLLLCHAAADLPVGKLIWCRAGPRMHRVPGETHHSVVARVGQTLR